MRNLDESSAAIDSLLAMLQTLRTAPGGDSLLAQIEDGRKVERALVALVERAFIAFLNNALERHARTAPNDSAADLKVKTIRGRLNALIESPPIRQPTRLWSDAPALEQHLIALMWAVRRPSRYQSAASAQALQRLKPMQQALERELDQVILANFENIASLGSLEQTLRAVSAGELEDWRTVLRDSAREILENYRAVGKNLEHARAALRQLSTSAASSHALDRDSLLERLNAEMRRAQRHRHPLSVALLGPDHIEDIRHLIGPEAAREVQRHYLRRISACARAYDTVASCNPHGLAWFLPGANPAQGVRALRKAQERINAAHYQYAGRSRPLPTFSAAVVGFSPGDDCERLWRRAETLVAHAKRAGPSHIEWEQERRVAAVPRAH